MLLRKRTSNNNYNNNVSSRKRGRATASTSSPSPSLAAQTTPAIKKVRKNGATKSAAVDVPKTRGRTGRTTANGKSSKQERPSQGRGRPRKSTVRPWSGSEAEEEVEEEKKPGWNFNIPDVDQLTNNSSDVLLTESDKSESDGDDDDDDDASLFNGYDQATTSSGAEGRPEEEEDDDDGEILCPWAELPPEQIPPLELPDSSTDLLIESDFLLETLEIYEVLLNFSSILQLSPFLFEDFCCALRNQSQSKLLCEIHIAFLRLFFRDEEEQHTIFCAPEANLSFSVLLQLLDHMNYAEVLRHYLESDESFPREVLDIVQKDNYPFVAMEKRLVVLKWMCGHFFETGIFKKMVKSGDKIKHDQHCRQCGKAGGGAVSGDLIPCAGCEAAYHPKCEPHLAEAMLREESYWFCEICKKHEVRGATDALLPGQTPLRKLPLGYDRAGRIYWFLVRRIFVYAPATNDIYYYSTLPQLYGLICALDPEHYERRLCRTLGERLPQIALQMHNTLELTDERRQQLQVKSQKETTEPYLHVNNAHLMAKIVAAVKAENVKQEVKVEEEDGEENVVDEVEDEEEEEGETSLVQMLKHLLCIHAGRLEATYWSGGFDELQLLLDHKIWTQTQQQDGPAFERLAEGLDLQMRRGMRLGFSDAGHRHYVNHYAVDDLAKSPYARAKERDKRRYLNTRFSLTEEGEFVWPNQKGASPFGSEPEVLRCILLSFRRLLERIPDGLMHRHWLMEGQKQRFLQRLQHCSELDALRQLLLLFERAMRKPAFLNVWWNCLALTRLSRTTSELREFRQKFENAKRKEEKILTSADPSEEPIASGIVWVKYSLLGGALPKHNIWRNREGNEQFRVNGMGALGGWLWVSSNLVRRILPLPERPDMNSSKKPSSEKKPASLASRKAARLRRICNKMLMWRTIEELGEQYRQQQLHPPPSGCYSPSCRLIGQSCAAGQPALGAFCPFQFGQFDQGFLLPCYSPSCLRRSEAGSRTARRARAKPPAGSSKDAPPARDAEGNGVLGEDVPFPFPEPYNFKHSSSGKDSILVLPQWCLKRLARQGGVSPNTLAPGFHPLAKANPLVWPYPCPRPLFDHCWRFLTSKAGSLHALALRFRQLYASIRWMDLWPPEPDNPDIRVRTHHADFDEVRTVVGHRENPPEGYYEQYKIRVDQYPLSAFEEEEEGQDGLGKDDKDYRSQTVKDAAGMGTQKRKRTARKRLAPPGEEWDRSRLALDQRRPRLTTERWIDGVDLKLYEIASYWHAYMRQALAVRRWEESEALAAKALERQQQYGKQYNNGEPESAAVQPEQQQQLARVQQQPQSQYHPRLLPLPQPPQMTPVFAGNGTVVVQRQQQRQQQCVVIPVQQQQQQQRQQRFGILSQPSSGTGGTTTASTMVPIKQCTVRDLLKNGANAQQVRDVLQQQQQEQEQLQQQLQQQPQRFIYVVRRQTPPPPTQHYWHSQQ